MSESVILCEGYYDRAFWAGWLTHLGCTDPGQRANGTHRIPVKDPWNVKEFAWSYMAGWYAELGSETFYRKLWSEDRSAAQLRSRLTKSGMWRVAEALAD